MTTRDIKIKKVLNGYIVKIGCQKVVFTKRKKLLKELARYWDDPDGVEKEYLNKHGRDTGATQVLGNGVTNWIVRGDGSIAQTYLDELNV